MFQRLAHWILSLKNMFFAAFGLVAEHLSVRQMIVGPILAYA